MGKINKIKIGAMVFDVIRKDDLKHPADNRRLDGHILYSESKIYLDSNLSYQAEMQTIWHEVLHGILTQAGGCKEEDEHLIEALAYGVMMVLDANPELANVKPK
jgi:hypothetical protein